MGPPELAADVGGIAKLGRHSTGIPSGTVFGTRLVRSVSFAAG